MTLMNIRDSFVPDYESAEWQSNFSFLSMSFNFNILRQSKENHKTKKNVLAAIILSQVQTSKFVYTSSRRAVKFYFLIKILEKITITRTRELSTWSIMNIVPSVSRHQDTSRCVATAAFKVVLHTVLVK